MIKWRFWKRNSVIEAARNEIFAKEVEQDLQIAGLMGRLWEMEVTMINHMQQEHRKWMADDDVTPGWVYEYTTTPIEPLPEGINRD